MHRLGRLGMMRILMAIAIVGFLNGCSQSSVGQGTNKAPADLAPPHSQSSETVLFTGNSLTVIKADQVALPEAELRTTGRSCISEHESKLNKKLSSLGLSGSIQYFEPESKQSYSFGPDKFVIKIHRNLFEQVGMEAWKKVDEYVGNTVTRRLFVLANDGFTKLLLIGNESAASGLGHLLRSHFLLSANSDSPAISFRSISDDPRRVGFSTLGTTYFVQIEPIDSDDKKASTTKSIRLKSSLLTVENGSSSPTLQAELNITCSDVNEIF